MTAVDPETVQRAAALASALNHLKANRLEYMVLTILLYTDHVVDVVCLDVIYRESASAHTRVKIYDGITSEP